MIRIDAAWLSVEPLDMRAGPDTALGRVVRVFGEARPHHAYLFANRRATRLKVLVHDGFGLWLCARRLHQGKFSWPMLGTSVSLTQEQLQALVLGLPWHLRISRHAGPGFHLMPGHHFTSCRAGVSRMPGHLPEG